MRNIALRVTNSQRVRSIFNPEDTGCFRPWLLHILFPLPHAIGLGRVHGRVYVSVPRESRERLSARVLSNDSCVLGHYFLDRTRPKRQQRDSDGARVPRAINSPPLVLVPFSSVQVVPSPEWGLVQQPPPYYECRRVGGRLSAKHTRSCRAAAPAQDRATPSPKPTRESKTRNSSNREDLASFAGGGPYWTAGGSTGQ